MSKEEYQFSFIFHETGAPIDLYFETYEEALASAKFHCEAFIEEAFRRSITHGNTQTTYQEYLKIAGDFRLSPNEQNFNFSDYFVTYFRFFEFEKSMENVWRGIISN